MKRLRNNIISVIWSLIRFSILKIFRPKTFKAHWLQRFSPSAQVYFLGKGTITLARGVRAHSRVLIKVIKGGKISIGSNTSINYGCMFFSMKNIEIGNGVEFGPNVLVYDHDHDFMSVNGIKDNTYLKNDVKIGNNCWIGANSVILRGTVIGENSVVAAGSILKGNYPADSVIVQKRDTTVIPIKK